MSIRRDESARRSTTAEHGTRNALYTYRLPHKKRKDQIECVLAPCCSEHGIEVYLDPTLIVGRETEAKRRATLQRKSLGIPAAGFVAVCGS